VAQAEEVKAAGFGANTLEAAGAQCFRAKLPGRYAAAFWLLRISATMRESTELVNVGMLR
jgi:hypothetical protein